MLFMHAPLPNSETANVSKGASQAVTTTAVQNTTHEIEHGDQSEGDFPDGGLTAWGTVLGA